MKAAIAMTPTKRRRVETQEDVLVNGRKMEDVDAKRAPVVGVDSASSTDSDDAWLSRKIEDGVDSESASDFASGSIPSGETSSSTDDAEDESDEDEQASESDQPPPDLKTRLAAFLPQLAKANETLSESERLDEVDGDEERYIEMNLGLGVLAEKPNGDEGVRTRDSKIASTPSSGDYEDDSLISAATKQEPQKKRKIEEVS